MSLPCKLVPGQYRGYEYGLLGSYSNDLTYNFQKTGIGIDLIADGMKMVLNWIVLQGLSNTYNPNFSLQNENVINIPRWFLFHGSQSTVASLVCHVYQRYQCIVASLNSYAWFHYEKLMHWSNTWSNRLPNRSLCWCMNASLACHSYAWC